MPSETIIELDPYLKPIDEEGPAGPDLRENGDKDFATIKAARRKIVSLAKAARFDPNVESEVLEQWREIRKLAPNVLKKSSKDLEVAAWFSEALLKIHGYAGLRDGFFIIKAMVENFWDDLHPRPDEDGMETRVYPLISLNGEDGPGTLILPLKNTPLFPDSDLNLTHTSYGRLQEAMQLSDPEEREAKISELGITEEAVQQQVNATTPEAAANLIDDVNLIVQTWNEIAETVDQKCRDADASDISVPVSGIRNALEEVRELYQQLLKNQLASPEEESTEEGADAPAGGTGGSGQAGTAIATGPIRSRTDAVNQLLLIANYFRTTEPHSPLCGAIERTANWARLPLQDLLKELIPDEGARMHYALMTGIQIGDDATPVGQLAQTAKATPAPSPAPKAESSGGAGWGNEDDLHSGF